MSAASPGGREVDLSSIASEPLIGKCGTLNLLEVRPPSEFKTCPTPGSETQRSP